MNYDAIVIGAGPAGGTAAKAIAEQGLRVLIIDKKAGIGLPVHCAGHIPQLLLKQVGCHTNSVIQKIEFMSSHMPHGERVKTRAPGLIIERSIFDQDLIQSATDAGAHVMTKTSALSRTKDGIIARNGKDNLNIKAKVIVGADGVKSTVGRWVNETNKDFIAALQFEVALTRPMNNTAVYFDDQFRGGYAWLFPRGMTANVGVGLNYRQGANLQRKMQYFLNKLQIERKIIKQEIIRRTVGLVPVSGYLNTVPDNNVLLVGDAAGHTDPITGSGILSAVYCGQIAGRVVAEAINADNLNLLSRYELQWKRLLQKHLDRAIRKRKLLDANWNKRDLDILLRKTWIAFGEYWNDG